MTVTVRPDTAAALERTRCPSRAKPRTDGADGCRDRRRRRLATPHQATPAALATPHEATPTALATPSRARIGLNAGAVSVTGTSATPSGARIGRIRVRRGGRLTEPRRTTHGSGRDGAQPCPGQVSPATSPDQLSSAQLSSAQPRPAGPQPSPCQPSPAQVRSARQPAPTSSARQPAPTSQAPSPAQVRSGQVRSAQPRSGQA